MRTKIIEVSQDLETGFNHGKFMVMRPDHEWGYHSRIDPGVPLLFRCGWRYEHIWVLDLQTGEGACFRAGGMANYDLDKKRIWVCPMFEPFLWWLYSRDLDDLSLLPDVVELPNAPEMMRGYRRKGS